MVLLVTAPGMDVRRDIPQGYGTIGSTRGQPNRVVVRVCRVCIVVVWVGSKGGTGHQGCGLCQLVFVGIMIPMSQALE